MKHFGKLMIVLSFLVVSGAAQVSGGGTAGYIPNWVNSNTLGNSNIFLTQGQIGIGTSSPAATLYVAGQNGGFNRSLNAPMAFQVAGGVGQRSQGAGGAGGSINLGGGPGAASGVSNGPGGAGGTVWINGGPGGNGFVNAGSGGAIAMAAGNGGGISSGAGGGTGASIIIAPGSAAKWSAGVSQAGSGGSIALQPGAAGGSGTSPGNAGAVLLAPNGGKVGIGEASPANTLEVVTGGTALADSWHVRSSRRFKVNIQPLQGALDKVEHLRAVSYDRAYDGKHELGVIAEEVDQVVPEVVSRDPATQEVQGVDYSRLAALLIEAVQEQQTQITQLKEQLQKLSTK